MKLIKLTLTNFKGIKSFEFEPNGADANVYGTNGSGKTTIFDALTWLLFDKGSNWEANFSPKVVDRNGAEVHGINNRVDGVFRLDDGKLITFSKDQSENWVKKRGGATESFAGNTTEYFIDGVPVKRGEYIERIGDICPGVLGQLLTQPLFFPEILDWKDRRTMLLDFCGDVSEFDVINSSPELNGITRFLLIPGTEGQFYSVPECQKVYVAKSQKIKESLSQLPARIDEVIRTFTNDNADPDMLEGLLSKLQKELDEALSEKAALRQNGADAVLRGQAAQIKNEIAEGRAAFIEQKNQSLAADREIIKSLQNRWQDIAIQKSGLSANISMARNKALLLSSQRDQLVKEYNSTSEKQWQGNTVCPTCGRELPEADIEAAKAKFNEERSSALETIRTRIEKTCSKSMIAQINESLSLDERSYEILDKEAEDLNVEIRLLKDKISPVEHAKYEDTEEFKKFAEKLAEIEAKITAGTNDISSEESVIQANIERYSNEIQAVQKRLGVIRANEQQKKRLADLESEEKHLQEALEDSEHCLYLCEQFIKTKVSMLDDKINARFNNVRFKLFDTQINGGVKEACEVLVPAESGALVPFSAANSAARLNAGLEIIDTFSKHFGISMPVVVDNAESVVELKNIEPQVIRLVVSGQDESLRVEVEGE